jgi:geranylgeranyl reductase family protein
LQISIALGKLQSKRTETVSAKQVFDTNVSTTQTGLMIYDVAIVGAGPAGSTSAAFCAKNGLRTIVLERETFPREKVCGDCVNPSCWPVLRRLEVAEKVRAARHARLDFVEFIDLRGRTLHVRLPEGENAEIAIKRSLFDFILLERARELGAEVRERSVVRGIRRTTPDAPWELTTSDATITARLVIAADGRNSSVGRLLGLSPPIGRDRVALQAHIPLPRDFGNRIVLQFLPGGYSGQAPVNDRELNLCLVGRPAALPELQKWAVERFHLAPEKQWRTVTPLTRRSIPPAHSSLFFIGDAARVVEPFTGEGIFYALNGGEIAAEMISRLAGGANPLVVRQQFRRAYAAMYRGRLWINALARGAVVSPRIGELLFQIARQQPALLRFLTSKISH